MSLEGITLSADQLKYGNTVEMIQSTQTSSPNNLICKTKEHLFVHIWKGDLHDICKIPVSFYEKVRKDTH